MRTRRRQVTVLVLVAFGLVLYIGCGDDDSGSSGSPDAGSDVAIDRNVQDTSPPIDAADARSPELTGSACKAPTDCYGGLPDAGDGGLKGEAVCIDKVTNGYCTHKCTTDADCCAVPGECRTGLKQVCAPFENTGDKYCFLSCEDKDIAAATDAGASDSGTAGDAYCTGNANPDFGCRSTGGGNQNRKVCLPVGTADGGKDAALDAPDAD